MKSLLTLILSGLVPVFGLVSCTDAPETAHVQDSWSLPAPQLVVSRGDQTFTRPLMKSEINPVEANAEIVFPGLGAKDFEKVTVTIESTCSSKSGDLKSTTTVSGTARVSLASLLQESFFLRVDYSEVSNIQCRLAFSAVNSIGSTHTFDSIVFIDHFESLETLALTRASETDAPKHDSLKLLSSSEATQIQLRGKYDASLLTHVHLVCDHWVNTRDLAAAEPFEKIISSLIDGPNANPSLRNAEDSRLIYPIQKCRFVNLVENSDGAKRVEISPLVTLNFPLPRAVIQSSVAIDYNHKGIMATFIDGQNIAVAQISNQSSVPILYRFPSARGQKMNLQMIEVEPSGAFAGVPFSADVTLALSGSSRSWEDGSDLVFEVAPGAVAQLVGTLHTAIKCQTFCIPSLNACANRTFAGFLYSFTKPFKLRRYVSWDSKSSTPGSEILTESAFADVNSGTTTFLENWLPHPEWKDLNSTSASPKNVTLAPQKLMEICNEAADNVM